MKESAGRTKHCLVIIHLHHDRLFTFRQHKEDVPLNPL